MSIIEQATNLIAKHEGYRPRVYKDTEGLDTIGIGFLVDESKKGSGLTREECNLVLNHRVANFIVKINSRYKWFSRLDDVRKVVIIDMVFNLGLDGLAKFKQTIKFIKQKDYDKAGVEMLDSKWARQVGKRAERLSKMMKKGDKK